MSIYVVCLWSLRHPLIKEVFFPGPGGCSSEALRIHNSQSSGPGPPVGEMGGGSFYLLFNEF